MEYINSLVMTDNHIIVNDIVINLNKVEASFTKEMESSFKAIKQTVEQANDFLRLHLNSVCLNLWCFEEMLANAIEHGNSFSANKKAFVEVKIIDNFIVFIITDEGEGFDWRKQMAFKSCLLADNERGRGVVMSKMLSTGMTYNEKGNQVIIIYNISQV
ncbi:ATP-binding protein [Desulfuribacillus alkaliarsenatis]|uniref:Histidine kinase/HSP90-like ATPase domain-containing protein n=1 Tax=Desulfuribacillus alkaliarsenatis TaxID=766136 RepID=A0A1E5G4P3_9FIRM|nr:ATP-binding protein [Desulfuribacillus alkaliarsenatis]OEF98150.1 hypothetical protein BHF68_00205 [Desulfuribacillus alkaliarsenatis]